MYERARLLLEQYYCARLKRGMSRRAEHLLHEVRGRLRTLQWLHSRLVQLDAEVEANMRAKIPPAKEQPVVMKCVFTDSGRPDCSDFRQAALPFGKADELRALLEAFYYCAFRVRDLVRNASELSHLSGLEAVGVRNVRNHLVEHPDGKSGVIVSSVAAGGPVGPQLRPMRCSLDPPGTNDAGLHENAREFNDALEASMGAIFAGFLWLYLMSSHQKSAVAWDMASTEDGEMNIYRGRFRDLSYLRDFANDLKASGRMPKPTEHV